MLTREYSVLLWHHFIPWTWYLYSKYCNPAIPPKTSHLFKGTISTRHIAWLPISSMMNFAYTCSQRRINEAYICCNRRQWLYGVDGIFVTVVDYIYTEFCTAMERWLWRMKSNGLKHLKMVVLLYTKWQRIECSSYDSSCQCDCRF